MRLSNISFSLKMSFDISTGINYLQPNITWNIYPFHYVKLLGHSIIKIHEKLKVLCNNRLGQG